jgi:hypothetical protein
MKDDNLVAYLVTRIENIDQKVDKLLEFKWQIIGGSVLMSALLAVLIQIASIFLNRG